MESRARIRLIRQWGSGDPTILEDMDAFVDRIVKDTGFTPTRALTSKTNLNRILRDHRIRAAIYGVNSDRVLTRAELNAFLAQQSLPQIAIYDKQYRQQDAKGKYSSARFLPESAFIMMPDGKLGDTFYGLTAEELELRKNPDVDVFFGPEIAHTEAEQKTGPVEVKKSGCHGFCEMGPLMRIEPMGILYTKVQLSDCEEIFYRTIERGDVIRHLLFKQDGIEYKKQEEIPFYKKQTRNVLKN